MNRSIILAAAAVCVTLSSCVNNTEKDFSDDQVMFSAKTGALETRTKYGADGSSPNKTYVDWVADDHITIAMSNNLSANYTLAFNHDGNDSDGNSRAIPSSSQTLTWSGSSPWTFWGVYPESGTNGSSLSVSGGLATASFTVPTKWTPESTDPETLTIDDSSPAVTYGYKFSRLPYGFMFATESNVTRRTSVSLTFYPKFTAFTITLKNTSSSPVEISSVKLSSTDVALAGTFYVDTSSGDIIYSGTKGIPNRDTNGNNAYVEVSFEKFTDGVLTIPGKSGDTDGEVTFTLVALPGSPITGRETSLTKLTLSVTSGSTTKNIKLGKLENNNTPTWQSFDAGKKHNISVTLPDFTNYEYTFEVVSPTDLTYEAGKSITASVTSYKNVVGSSTKELVEWEVAGYYSSEEDALSTAIADNNNTPSWLTSGLSYDSSTTPGQAQSLSLVHSAITIPSGSGTTISSDIQNSINQSIKSVECGSPANPINLANPTNTGSNPSTYIAESANSYIVNHPGWYKIPVVMGNGIKQNGLNLVVETYEGVSGNNTEKFVDYSNATISSPILSEFSTASIVWQAGTGTVVEIPESNYKISPASGDPSVYWLKFHVTAKGQGNAVIAVKDNNGTIMWSYHIWVTHYVPHIEDVSITNSKSITYNVMPFTLGWITESGKGTKYNGTSVYVRIRQKGSSPKAPLVMKLACPDIYTFSDQPTGKNPFYQWGRKDPFPPDGIVTTENLRTNYHNEYGVNSVYYLSIAKPETYLYRYNGGILNTWLYLNSYKYYNLWSASCNVKTQNDNPVVKTIYDPSPAGYTLPASNAFDEATMTRFIGATGYLDYYKSNNNAGVEQGVNAFKTNANCFLWTAVCNDQYAWHAYAAPGANKSFTSSGTSYGTYRGFSVLPMQNSN